MGEYARRKSDKVEIKIGTMERMYYLRYEDRKQVEYIPKLGDKAFLKCIFRLPFPDEDKVAIGEYAQYDRGGKLINFSLTTDSGDTGIIQLTHESGVCINLTCHHGNKLPEVTGEASAFWNGKDPHCFELVGVKFTASGLLPVASCKWCQLCWSMTEWDKVLPCVPDDELRARLERYKDCLTS